MTTREAILEALANLLQQHPFFPEAEVDEPEPSRWVDVDPAHLTPASLRASHALAVQDGPPPDHLSHVRGANGDALEELELEAAVAYGVRVEPGAGDTRVTMRAARRKLRDQAIEHVAAVIAANRNLGLGVEVWAEVGPVDRQDEVAFANATAVATAVIPIRVLYTAAHAAG